MAPRKRLGPFTLATWRSVPPGSSREFSWRLAPAPGERGEADSRNDKWAGQASGEAPGWGPRKKRAPSPRSAGVRPQRRVGEVKDDSRPLPGAGPTVSGAAPGDGPPKEWAGRAQRQREPIGAHGKTFFTFATWCSVVPGSTGEDLLTSPTRHSASTPGNRGEAPFTPATWRGLFTWPTWRSALPGRRREGPLRNDQVRLTSATWRRGPSSSGVPTPGHPRSGALEPNAR